MLLVEPLASIFGLPLVLSEAEANDLKSDLEAVASAMGADLLASSGPDLLLKKLRDLYDPVAREQTVRDRIAEIEPIEEQFLSPLTHLLCVELGLDRVAITLEGLAAYVLLVDTAPESGVVAISPRVAAGALEFVRSQYSDLARQRSSTVARYLRGEGPPMHPAVAAMVLILLINRHDTSERALPVGDRDLVSALTRALGPSITAFADAISPGRRDPGEFSLKGGWLLSEANRRLGPAFVRKDKVLYVRSDDADRVVALLGRDLGRRSDVDAPRLEAAMEEFLRAFHEETFPDLVHLGHAHEDSINTRKTIRQVLEAFRRCELAP